MSFISEAASAIKSRFGFLDPHSESETTIPAVVKSTPNLKKASSSTDLSTFRSTGDEVPESTTATPHSFELSEDPSFWKDHNVQVIIRLRPLNKSEISLQGHVKCVKQESSQTIAWTGHPETRFTFDAVADETISQEKLFKVAGVPMVENCVAGYNSCMFAYGQTGSGKTHTMLGDIEGGTRRHSVNCGMTPRVFEYMFQRIQKEREARRDEKIKFTCKCSFLEIYNEQILDLLDPSSNNLQIREDHKKGVHVENLKETEVSSARDVMQQLLQGAANRKVAATNMNLASSRSHSVFTCIIESKWESQGVTHHRFARLNLVDLAGSERQKSSGAEGERLKEATNINKSLSTLGLVIMNLVSLSNGKSLHVPYRDSKLTFLLQDSLGGNSKTTIIANISPSICCSAETLSTLKFAQRAKFIKNNAIVNEDASGDVIALRSQIHQLKREVARLRSLGNVGHQSLESETGSTCVLGSPGSLKWDGLQGSSSPLAIDKRVSSKKEYEAAIVAALKREQDKEMSLQAMAVENQAALHLVKQREDEIRALKMRLRFREAGVKRLEQVVSGDISAESHLLKENDEYLKEIEVLRAQVDRNHEVTRFAMENLRLKEELRRLKSFVEEGEREMLQEQITLLKNKLLEALDWKLMHEADSSLKEPRSPWQSSSNEENEFLRMQEIQHQSEIDSLRRKLSKVVEEKGTLERKLEGLRKETETASAVDMGAQMELKAMVDAIASASQREAEAHEMAIFLSRENDELRLKLKTLVEDNNKLIELYERAAAEINKVQPGLATDQINEDVSVSVDAEKEAKINRKVGKLEQQLADMREENERLMCLYEKVMQERHETVSVSVDAEKDTEMNRTVEKLKQLDDMREENERLMGLYEQVMQERDESVSVSVDPEKDTEMNRTVEKLEQQLADMREENERLMGLYEKVMQERDESVSVSVDAEKDTEMNRTVEKLKQQLDDMREENERLMGLYEQGMQERDEYKRMLLLVEQNDSPRRGHVNCAETFVQRNGGESMKSDERMTFTEAELLPRFNVDGREESLSEIPSKAEVSIDNSLADVSMMNLHAAEDAESIRVTVEKVFGLKLVRQKLGVAEDKLCSSKKSSIPLLHTLEKALVDIMRVSKDLEDTECQLHVKKQNLKQLGSLSSEMLEKRVNADRKLTALKHSLGNFLSSIAYYDLREERAKGRVKEAVSHLSQKEEELVRLQAIKHKSKAELSRLQQSEVELETALTCLKPKLRLESENVLLPIENIDHAENIPIQTKQIPCNAMELLLSEEKVVSLRKKINSLKRRIMELEKDEQRVQLEVQRASKPVEEMDAAFKQVALEKQTIFEMIDNGKQEYESMVIEYQQSDFEALYKELELQAVEEDLANELQRILQLQLHRAVIIEEINQLIESQQLKPAFIYLSDKLGEEMQDAQMLVSEAMSLLHTGSNS